MTQVGALFCGRSSITFGFTEGVNQDFAIKYQKISPLSPTAENLWPRFISRKLTVNSGATS